MLQSRMSAEEEDAVQSELAALEEQLVSDVRLTMEMRLKYWSDRAWSRNRELISQVHLGRSYLWSKTKVRLRHPERAYSLC